jgi:putative transposase
VHGTNQGLKDRSKIGFDMSQSLARVIAHGIFSTKERTPNLDPSIHPELFAYLAAILNDEGHLAVKVGGHVDHVHMLFGLSRTKSIANTIETVKTSTSKWIKTKGLAYQGFAWQHGYGIFGVSESNVDAAVRYIANQDVHHEKHSFQEEYRALMRKHGIPIDERYVWD